MIPYNLETRWLRSTLRTFTFNNKPTVGPNNLFAVKARLRCSTYDRHIDHWKTRRNQRPSLLRGRYRPQQQVVAGEVVEAAPYKDLISQGLFSNSARKQISLGRWQHAVETKNLRHGKIKKSNHPNPNWPLPESQLHQLGYLPSWAHNSQHWLHFPACRWRCFEHAGAWGKMWSAIFWHLSHHFQLSDLDTRSALQIAQSADPWPAVRWPPKPSTQRPWSFRSSSPHCYCASSHFAANLNGHPCALPQPFFARGAKVKINPSSQISSSKLRRFFSFKVPFPNFHNFKVYSNMSRVARIGGSMVPRFQGSRLPKYGCRVSRF